MLVELDGEAMPQIEEKLRSPKGRASLRYVTEEKVDFCASSGMTSGALGTLVAAVRTQAIGRCARWCRDLF